MREQVEKILASMDIPEARRELTRANIRWLQRNAGVRNGNHPDLKLLLNLLRKL